MKFAMNLLGYYNNLKSVFVNRKFLNGFNSILLLIIPLFYAIVWFLFADSLDSYYYTGIDPEYAYLMNGIAVIENNGRVDYIDHPGTTLQVFIAGTIKLIHFFRDEPLMEDVLRNPELYLKSVNVILNVMLIMLILFSGRFIYRKIGNIGLSLFFQATPLLFFIPHFMSRIIPETLAVLLLLILILLIFDFIESNNEIPSGNKYPVLFSISIAAILATKISMFPVFFIPLFLLGNAKKRLLYSGLTALLFFVFAYPVLLNFNRFFQWIASLFLHSGYYGSGDKNILSGPDFVRNLETLYFSYHMVFYLLFVNLAIIAGGILLKIRKRLTFPTDQYNAFIGLSLCYIFQIVMICKHFSLNYFLPSLIMVTLNVYLIITFLFSFWKIKYAKKIESGLYLIAVITILVFTFRYVKTDTRYRYEAMRDREKTTHFINAELSDYPVAFNENDKNPRQEVALWFGSLYARVCRPLVDKLNEIYPNRYFYVDSYDSFIDWYNYRYKLNEIIRRHDSVYFFDNKAPVGLKKFLPDSVRTDSIAIDTLYTFFKLNENITLFSISNSH